MKPTEPPLRTDGGSVGDSSAVALVGRELTRNIVRAALLAVLIGVFSQVSFDIPLSTVPVTLQLLGVYLAGILLGPVWGPIALVLYVVAGIAGAPVFADRAGGLGVLIGPTGGYLVGMPISACLIGLLVHGRRSLGDPAERSIVRLLGALLLGTVVIYAFGTAWLFLQGSFTLEAAIVSGALIFVPGEVLKIAAAIGIVRSDEITAA